MKKVQIIINKKLNLLNFLGAMQKLSEISRDLIPTKSMFKKMTVSQFLDLFIC